MSEASVLSRPDGSTFGLFSAVGDHPGAPVLVLSPAMGMPAAYYGRFLDAAAADGLHALAYEQRGHEVGGVPASRRRDFGYAELIADLEQVIAHARSTYPDSAIHVVGHSLGGQVAVAGLGRRPDLCDGLILMASSTPHWRDWDRRVLVAAYAFPAIAAVLGHFPGHRLRFAGREARTMITQWGRLARTGVLPEGEAGLGRVTLPVLAVSVQGDWLGPARAVDALCAKLPGATVARVHVDAPGIDHFKWARTPSSVLPQISRWVAALPARG